MTVISTVNGADGVRSASVSRNAVDVDSVLGLVAEADATARDSAVSDDAASLISGDADADWDTPAIDAPIASFSELAEWLGDIFGAARAAEQGRYGFAEHSMSTTFLGTSTGLRRRHVQPKVRVELTGRTVDGGSSAWSGRGGADVATVDLAGLEAEVAQRLDWSKRRVSLDAGRYNTILPPSAVADLMLYAYWSSGALDAHEGQSVYSKAGGGTRVGEKLTDVPLTLHSDPAMPDQGAVPFVVCEASSRIPPPSTTVQRWSRRTGSATAR